MSAFGVLLDSGLESVRSLEPVQGSTADEGIARSELPGDGRRVRLRRAGLDVLFDGRLDNRQQLFDQLLPESAGLRGASDIELAVLAYRRWGVRCFEQFLGPFAMAVVDTESGRLVAGRDPLGDRTLCYHQGSSEMVIATEASAILDHPSVSSRLDEVTLAKFFAVDAPASGSTFFAEIRELPPGHVLVYDRNKLRLEQFWPPAELPSIRYRTDGEYVEHFRSLLVESVRCRMPSSSVPAVLMSGGLDSTSVAALAASELDDREAGTRLPVISWVFDDFPGADERAFMDPMIDRFSLSAHRIHGDGDWPLRDLQSWPLNPNAPWQGLYCRLQNKAYAAARRAGATVLLTGEYGDHLYQDGALWLRGLLAEGRWVESWQALRREVGEQSLLGIARGGPVRGAVARALGVRRRQSAQPWLTPAAQRLADSESSTAPSALPGVLDPRCAHTASLEVSNASKSGIDVRRPFRDRRLIEFVLSIPAHLLYRPGWSKWILRQAMAGILPEPVRLRRHVSSLLPLAARGLAERELSTVRDLLAEPEALWRRYVRSDWLSTAFPQRLQQQLDGIEAVIPWQCICSELWTQNRKDNLL